jgi:hypothetical protein
MQSVSTCRGDGSQKSAHAGVAMPLDFCHLVGRDLGLEWTVVADAVSAVFHYDLVLSGRQREAELPLIVGLKGRDRPLSLPNDELLVGKWFSRVRHSNSDWSGMSRSEPNYAFKPGVHFGCSRRRLLRPRKAGEKEGDHKNSAGEMLSIHILRSDTHIYLSIQPRDKDLRAGAGVRVREAEPQ